MAKVSTDGVRVQHPHFRDTLVLVYAYKSAPGTLFPLSFLLFFFFFFLGVIVYPVGLLPSKHGYLIRSRPCSISIVLQLAYQVVQGCGSLTREMHVRSHPQGRDHIGESGSVPKINISTYQFVYFIIYLKPS